MFSDIAWALPQSRNMCLESLALWRDGVSLRFTGRGKWGGGWASHIFEYKQTVFLCVFQHDISYLPHLNSHSRQCSPLGHECCSTFQWTLQSIIFGFCGAGSEAIKMTGSAWDWKIYVCGKTLWNSKYILIRKNWLGSCMAKDVLVFFKH